MTLDYLVKLEHEGTPTSFRVNGAIILPRVGENIEIGYIANKKWCNQKYIVRSVVHMVDSKEDIHKRREVMVMANGEYLPHVYVNPAP